MYLSLCDAVSQSSREGLIALMATHFLLTASSPFVRRSGRSFPKKFRKEGTSLSQEVRIKNGIDWEWNAEEDRKVFEGDSYRSES